MHRQPTLRGDQIGADVRERDDEEAPQEDAPLLRGHRDDRAQEVHHHFGVHAGLDQKVHIHLGRRTQPAQDHAGARGGQRHPLQRHQTNLFTVRGEHDPLVEDIPEGVLVDLGSADRVQRVAAIQPEELVQALSQAHPGELQGLEERCRITKEIGIVTH